jgi:hypothetical protein
MAVSAIFGGTSTFVAAPADAAVGDAYIAITYSPITGYIGWATNAQSAQQAAEVALDKCYSQGRGCELAAWARNGCAALALGSGRWGGGSGPDAATAQAQAAAKVVAGRIVEVQCTG